MSSADEDYGWGEKEEPGREEERRTEVPQRSRGGEPQGAVPPTQVALVQHEPMNLRDFLGSLASDESLEDQQKLMQAYDRACHALVGPGDVQQEGNRTFKKKSAWRKLARFFHISTQILERRGWWERVMGAEHFVAEVVVRAVAPWGQYMEAVGACSTLETRFTHSYPWCPKCEGPMYDNRDATEGWKAELPAFTCRDKGCNGALEEEELEASKVGQRRPNPTAVAKARHDCLATAQTRATNRAVSDLIAAGEVSWEEAQGGDESTYTSRGRGSGTGSGRGGSRGQPATLDSKIGWGQHRESTWREVAEQEPSWAWWAVKEADKTPDAIRDALRDLLTELAETRAQDGHGQESQDPGERARARGSTAMSEEQQRALQSKVPSGKHQGEPWSEVAREDPDYLRRMVGREWGQEAMPVGSALRDALVTLLVEPAEANGEDYRGEVLERLELVELEPEELEHLAQAHPRYPDTVEEWTEQTWAGVARNMRVHGTHALLARARRHLKEQQPPPPEEPQEPSIPPRLTKDMREKLAKAEELDMPELAEWREGLEYARDEGDAEALEQELDRFTSALYSHMAHREEEQEEAEEPAGPQEPEPEAGEDSDGGQDDLPF